MLRRVTLVGPARLLRPDAQNHSMPITSPPQALPKARHVSTLIELRKNRTLPSHIAAFTPWVCRLRTSCIRGSVLVEVVVHGKFGTLDGPQPPPVITSVAAGLFGVW